jgi:hypothetical protein
VKGIFRAQLTILFFIGSLGVNLPQPALNSPAQAALNQSGAITIETQELAPDNKLAWCNDPNSRVPFGNKDSDKGRCMTFHYQIPAGGINSASLFLAIEPLGGLQDTDATVIAVSNTFPNDYCAWGKGDFPGCVALHGGFVGNQPSLDIDLFNLKCDKAVPELPAGAQEAVIASVRSGTIHVMLEDDTAVYRAQLVLNGPPLASCGQSDRPGTPGVAPGGNGASGSPGAGNSGTGTGSNSGANPGNGTATGANLPPPAFGSPEPANVRAMTLQGGQRRVLPGGLVEIPIWLVNGANVANMNFTVAYDPAVAVIEGSSAQGFLLDQALYSSNPRDTGLFRGGFAQTSGLNGTGVVAYMPFRAVGKPGTKTELHLEVTTINNPGGTVLPIDKISGSIEILSPDGWTVGDCDGDGNLTAIDARCALEVSVNLRPTIARLDIDNSGDTTSRDATLILQKARPITRQ